MSKRIKVTELPTFDLSNYLDSEAAIAPYLRDILEANDAALLASAQGEIGYSLTDCISMATMRSEGIVEALRTMPISNKRDFAPSLGNSISGKPRRNTLGAFNG